MRPREWMRRRRWSWGRRRDTAQAEKDELRSRPEGPRMRRSVNLSLDGFPSGVFLSEPLPLVEGRPTVARDLRDGWLSRKEERMHALNTDLPSEAETLERMGVPSLRRTIRCKVFRTGNTSAIRPN